MSRLTLRLPQTLHTQLIDLADLEGVSLNQYIVYALSRQATLAYAVQPVSEQVRRQQQSSFAALLQSLGQASFDEIEVLLSEREEVEAEPGLTPDIVKKLQERITTNQQVEQLA